MTNCLVRCAAAALRRGERIRQPVPTTPGGSIMLCSEIMKTDVECVSPDTSLNTAARKMRDQNIGFLPVCDDSMRPIGTITDRDIAIRAVAGDLPVSSSVESCMTREVISCGPQDDVQRARELMEEHQKSRIMCTDGDGRVQGVISLSDIAELDENLAAHALKQVSQREARGDSRHRPAL
jgi:CBS domain-containing protein